MTITHTITITLNNDWTTPEKQKTITEVNNIPENVLMSCRYDKEVNATVCGAIWTEEKEEG